MIETIHKEIDAIIQSKQTEIDVMDSKQKAALHKQEDEIKHTITEIKQVIQDLNILRTGHQECQLCFQIPVQD